MTDENIKLDIQPIIDNVNDTIVMIPKLVFIVPYRDREQQKAFFIRQMTYVLEDMNPTDYEIYFAHQCDTRDFNRGAMKNIGFIAIKDKYPNNYQEITFVFNDVDTMPYTKNFLNYDTVRGTVKHFYGYTYSLGGIVSIKGCDYEKTNGFPNLWAWGYEDNMFQQRVLACGLKIDRSQFYNIMDKNILQMKDGLDRVVNRNEYTRYLKNTTNGLKEITNISYQIVGKNDYINITTFEVGIENNKNKNETYDIRKGNIIFNKINTNKQMVMQMKL